MNNIKISANELSDTITKELKQYTTDVTKSIKKETAESANKLKKLTKSDAPRSKKNKAHYVDSITIKKIYESEFDATWIWYVKKPNYRLSHLLENGHKIVRVKNGKSYTTAYHFIANSRSVMEKEFVKNVERILKNGK